PWRNQPKIGHSHFLRRFAANGSISALSSRRQAVIGRMHVKRQRLSYLYGTDALPNYLQRRRRVHTDFGSSDCGAAERTVVAFHSHIVQKIVRPEGSKCLPRFTVGGKSPHDFLLTEVLRNANPENIAIPAREKMRGLASIG